MLQIRKDFIEKHFEIEGERSVFCPDNLYIMIDIDEWVHQPFHAPLEEIILSGQLQINVGEVEGADYYLCDPHAFYGEDENGEEYEIEACNSDIMDVFDPLVKDRDEYLWEGAVK